MSQPRLIALFLALATLLVYLPVTQHEFTYYDDVDYITQNFVVLNGLTWSGVKWAFTTTHAANWHPLTWLSHMVDCSLFGLNAGAHHFVNALIHAANTALVFALLWRLTAQVWPALVVAALFGWHPLHVESVAWAAERKDVLSTCLGLLAMLQYVQFARQGRPASYLLAVFFFALSLLAKPMLVTFPFVLLLLDFWPLKRLTLKPFQGSLIWEKVPFLMLAAASCIITFLAQRAGGTVSSLERWPLWNRIENADVSYVGYLLKTFWPVHLAAFYPWDTPSGARLLGSGALIVLISAAVWCLRRRHPGGLMGWLWFLGTLVPVIGLVQVGHAPMADRYSYFPCVGIFIAVIYGLHEWAGPAPGRLKILAATEILGLFACILTTEKQLTFWQNTETLFRHSLAVTRNNNICHDMLGSTYYQEGRYYKALVEYEETLRLNPRRPGLRVVIGQMLAKLGRPDEALAIYQQDLRQDGQFPDLHVAIGSLLAEQGQTAAAIAQFQEAAELDTHCAPPHVALAKMYYASGQAAAAANELLAAFHAEPNDYHNLAEIAHFMAANADEQARDPQTALMLTRKAAVLSANQEPEVFDAMGMAYAAAGDFSNATVAAQMALEISTGPPLEDIAAFHRRLNLYQNHLPWRESFLKTNAVPVP